MIHGASPIGGGSWPNRSRHRRREGIVPCASPSRNNPTVASWTTRSGMARRIGGVALVLVGIASLGILFVPDIGVPGRIANSVGALLQFGAAALILLPARNRD